MTVQEYRDAGLMVSANVSAQVLTSAETLVERAYLAPLRGVKPKDYELEETCIMCLAYLYVLQSSNTFATRAGAKGTAITASVQASQQDDWNAVAARCRNELEFVAEQYGGHVRSCDDICSIYFSTNFLIL